MESLPLMLQAALLLLGCALSRYLWGVDIIVASVVLGVTSSGAILYIFIVVAGAASESCPYQTPGSRALHSLAPKVQSTLYLAASIIASAFRRASEGSETVNAVNVNVRHYHPWRSRDKIMPFLKDVVLNIPRALAIDVYHLGRVTVRGSTAFRAGAYHLGSTNVRLLVDFALRAYVRLHGIPSAPEQGSDQQTTVLELRCISWMVQTSLDKTIHLSTLKHLATMVDLANFNSTPVIDCFSTFSCIDVSNRKAAIIQGLEQLATASATCFLRTFHHLSAADPTSSVLEDVRRRYRSVFPFGVDFMGLPFHYTIARTHVLVNRRWNPNHVQRNNYRSSAQEHIGGAQDMAEAAQVEYQKTQHRKVPCWILHFVLHSLSLYPPPPMPVVVDCLRSTIAIDLGCDVSNAGATTPDERCVHILRTTAILTLNQHTDGANFGADNSEGRNTSRS